MMSPLSRVRKAEMAGAYVIRSIEARPVRIEARARPATIPPPVVIKADRRAVAAILVYRRKRR